MTFRPLIALSLAAGLLSACDEVRIPDLSALLPGTLPAMMWDAKSEAAGWTARALAAVAAHDGELAGRVPADVATYCPAYAKASRADRRAFWVGLMSATAKHESSFNPKASGGGGRYIGLMQIAPATARRAGCAAQSSAALKDAAANLECAVQVFAPHVAADGVVAGNGRQGVARDWGPFGLKSRRAEIAAWTAAQDYCQG